MKAPNGKVAFRLAERGEDSRARFEPMRPHRKPRRFRRHSARYPRR